MSPVFLIVGAPATGKSTVSRALAARFPKSIAIGVDDSGNPGWGHSARLRIRSDTIFASIDGVRCMRFGAVWASRMVRVTRGSVRPPSATR